MENERVVEIIRICLEELKTEKYEQSRIGLARIANQALDMIAGVDPLAKIVIDTGNAKRTKDWLELCGETEMQVMSTIIDADWRV